MRATHGWSRAYLRSHPASPPPSQAWIQEEGGGTHSPNDECDEVREARLLKAQVAGGLYIAVWADGSSLLNKPWQLATWHLLYDPVLFVHGRKVERECRRPEVFFIVQDGDGLVELMYHCGVRLEELHALNEPLELPGGLRLRARVRYSEGDNPEHQRSFGICSGGGAEQGCCKCKGKRSEFTDLVKSGRAGLRSLREAVELAKQAARAGEVYKLRYGPDQGTASDVCSLCYEFGVEGGVGRTRKENEQKLREFCQGYTSAPAFNGHNTNALEEVRARLE